MKKPRTAMSIRDLAAVLTRSKFAALLGKAFGGKRDYYETLGYPKELTLAKLRLRFERDGVANRIVKALPNATWRGGAEIVEDPDPDVNTPFEKAFAALDQRLKIWDALRRADILSGIAQYGVLMFAVPGELDQPAEKVSADQIAFLRAYAEDDAPVQKLVDDPKDPRFGLPLFYTVTRTHANGAATQALDPVAGRQIHYSRVLHLSDGLLDDRIYGEPRLMAVWNYLDDLIKVSGGGAEAFWRRADRGTLFDLDPTLDFKDGDDAAMQDRIDDYEHGLKRYLLTRGVTPHEMGSDVADFSAPVLSIISLISATTGIPQRVLLGSEQGKLASKQDRGNWDDRVADRRAVYAEPMVIRPLIDKLIGWGALPTPADGYETIWPALKEMGVDEKAMTALTMAQVNQAAGEMVITPDEIRKNALGLAPIADLGKLPKPVIRNAPAPAKGQRNAAEGGAPGEHLLTVADRFRPAVQAGRARGLRYWKGRAEPVEAGARPEGGE